jgi:hypothetical protein
LAAVILPNVLAERLRSFLILQFLGDLRSVEWTSFSRPKNDLLLTCLMSQVRNWLMLALDAGVEGGTEQQSSDHSSTQDDETSTAVG